MYIDNTITTEFTGYYDSEDEVYVYPSARQNAIIAFDGFYLSAADGDFTTDGLTISTNTGDSTDISIGKATSAVLSAAILNPDDKMASLSWGEGMVRIGFVSNVSSAMVYADSQAVIFKTIYYGFNAAGRAFAASTVGGPLDPDVKPLAAVAYNDNTARYYYSDGSVYYYNGDTIALDTANAFMTAKFANREDAPIALLLDADGFPKSVNDITNDTFTVYKYVPMGVYDFSTVDAYNITFSAEAYDHMIAFDADATDWVQSLDFTNPKTVSGLVGELMTEMGFAYTIPATAVNTALTISKNPVTDYSVSYRQILAWLAETMGCNVRMSRTGSVEFYTYSASPVMTITPDVIASQTREVSRYTIPQITRVVCYNTLGAAYTSGTVGQDYTILGNPFLDPSASTACIDNLLTLLSAIPAFNTTSFTDACADPRIDAGDFLTIERTDGTSYVSPVMHQTLTWRGMCAADYESTGNQTREVPSSEAMSAFEGTVNSNPSAVIAKIEAEGISADWITSGKLTVLDNNDNVLFEADKEQNAVQISGFTVEDDRLTASTEPDATHTLIVNVATEEIGVQTEASGVLESEISLKYPSYLYATNYLNGAIASQVVLCEHFINLTDRTTGADLDITAGAIHYRGMNTGADVELNKDFLRFMTSAGTTQVTPALVQTSGTVKAGESVEVGNGSSNGAVTIQQVQASSADPYNLKFNSTSSRYMAQHGMQYSRMYDSGISGTAPATSGSVNNTTRNPSGFWASDNTSFSAATKGSAMTREDGFVAKDGSEVVTHDSNGLSWEHGTGATSSMRMFTLTHTSTVTAETTYTIDLPYGTYLFLHSRYTTPVAAAQGAQLVTIGSTSGTTALITLLAGGADLTATSGTRSQVSISKTIDGTATVTWTIQGRSYRRLVMVRLM